MSAGKRCRVVQPVKANRRRGRGKDEGERKWKLKDEKEYEKRLKEDKCSLSMGIEQTKPIWGNKEEEGKLQEWN
jgi:hypothetical protein